MPTNNKLPAFINDLLENSWEQICYLAYDGYTSYGRGVVVIDEDAEEESYSAEYVVYDLAKIDENWTNLVREYETDAEFILQFLDEAQNIRTVRIRTPEGRQKPKGIWFFAALEETMDNPDTLESCPKWFLDVLAELDDLEKEQKKKNKR